MRYQGGKHRQSKYWASIIQAEISDNKTYIEPFVGGCNMMDKIIANRRIGVDNNKYLISMWTAVLNGWIPPSKVSEEEFLYVMRNKNKHPQHLVGFVGFGCTYGGGFNAGYARCKKGRNYALESKTAILRQAKLMDDVVFLCDDYTVISEYKDAVIYLDKPYKNTRKYSNPDFDEDRFWDWAKQMAKNNTVFISEYSAPNFAKVVHEIEITRNFRSENLSEKVTEKLYRLL
jgi:DNA adenine methylase